MKVAVGATNVSKHEVDYNRGFSELGRNTFETHTLVKADDTEPHLLNKVL